MESLRHRGPTSPHDVVEHLGGPCRRPGGSSTPWPHRWRLGSRDRRRPGHGLGGVRGIGVLGPRAPRPHLPGAAYRVARTAW